MNEQEQIINLVIEGLVSSPEETLQQLSQLSQLQPDALQQIALAIMQKAQSGDAKASQAAQILQLATEGALKAQYGAKLNYLKRLLGVCPEGYKMAYFKAGGKVCNKCVQEAKCGSKMKKPKKCATGGISNYINDFKDKFSKGGKSKCK